MPSERGRLARSLATLDGIARVAQTEVDATAPMNRVVSGLTVAGGKMITAVPSPERVAARSTCVAYPRVASKQRPIEASILPAFGSRCPSLWRAPQVSLPH